MSPDKNGSQNEPKPEKKMGIDKGGLGHADPNKVDQWSYWIYQYKYEDTI